jgi:hypothetical protein
MISTCIDLFYVFLLGVFQNSRDNGFGSIRRCTFRANSSKTIAQIRKTAPTISMFFRRSLTGIWLYWRLGVMKKKNTTANETALNGKFIQKHQRQDLEDSQLF